MYNTCKVFRPHQHAFFVDKQRYRPTIFLNFQHCFGVRSMYNGLYIEAKLLGAKNRDDIVDVIVETICLIPSKSQYAIPTYNRACRVLGQFDTSRKTSNDMKKIILEADKSVMGLLERKEADMLFENNQYFKVNEHGNKIDAPLWNNVKWLKKMDWILQEKKPTLKDIIDVSRIHSFQKRYT